MTARGHLTAPGMMRYGPPPGAAGRRPLDPPELVAQVAEMDRLLMENRRLAASIRVMRQDLGAAQDELQRLKSHIRSNETESDIQIRVLQDKIGKMESGIKASENVKKDLFQAHEEAQSLVAARNELGLKIMRSIQELESYRTDIKNIPDMVLELDNMRHEHQRLRSAFEHEKHINLDLVERMQSMESNLVATSVEVEKLKAEVLNAEKRAQVPNGGAYPNSDPQYPTLYQRNDPGYDPYTRAFVRTSANGTVEGLVPQNNANSTPPSGIRSIPPSSGAGVPMPWGGGAYDPNSARK